jgi:Flp pilus assembly protein TadG
MRKKGKAQEHGQSLVELALVLPVLLLLLLGLVDFGRVYYATVSLYDAAEEGAIYAAAFPDDALGAQQRASEATTGLITLTVADVDPPVFAADSHTPGSAVTVTVTYDFYFYTPMANMFFPDSRVTLRGEAVKAVIGGG